MEQKRKTKVVILITGIVLMGMANYLYYKQEIGEAKGKQTVSNTTEVKDVTESINSSEIEH